MKTISTFSRATLALSLLLAFSSAHSAGLIEQILANPRVQALMGTPANVTNLLGVCKNDAYRNNNPQACADAVNADTVLRLPFEMRTVMSNPTSAQSLRDLCLAAQSTAQRDSYLCTQLASADKNFATSLSNQRNINNNQGWSSSRETQ
jgi:hypothetical protein